MSVEILSTFEKKRALVTGGLGFIGSHLARRLVKLGAEVSIIDFLAPEYGGNLFNLAGIEGEVSVTIADIRDEAPICKLLGNQDYLFNLAGQPSHTDSMVNPETDLDINAAGQLSLLKLCRDINPAIRVVYAGTRQVYGRPRNLPVDEDHPLEPIDFNGISKLAGERYHMLFHKIYGLQTTSLRMINTYGPHMRVRDARQTFVGWWLRQAIEGQELQIFGNGMQMRDLNYVDDVVDALLLSVADPSAIGQVYNLGGDEPVSLLELARRLIELNGSGTYRLTVFPEDRKRIEIGSYIGNYSKIRKQLGWQPKTPLSIGLRQTLDFYRQHHEHYW